MTNNNFKRKRIPSQTLILPPGEAWWAVTAPGAAENKWDEDNKNWSIRVRWSGEGRAAVEKLLGPMLPEFLETKKAELLEEAAGNKIKEKRILEGDAKVGPIDYETPWREVLDKETAEPTGEIEIVFKRTEMKTVRGQPGVKEPNSPPLVVDAMRNATSAPIRNRSTVIVKFATWPVYFASDNKVGMKRLLESIQVRGVPSARTPDASGFEEYDDGPSPEGEDNNGQAPVSSGADY